MLTTPNHLLVLNRFENDFQEDLLCQFSRDRGEADRPVVLHMLLLAHLESRGDIHLPQTLQPFKEN